METKKQIIETYLKLGMKEGFNKVSLQNIADETGIRKASIFSHFSSFDNLKGTAIDYALKELANISSDLNTKADNAEELLISAVNTLIDSFETFPVNALLSMTEQQKQFSEYFYGLSEKFDLMISARLTVALDYCVQRSWIDFSDTDSLSNILTPLVRKFLTDIKISEDTISEDIHTIIKILQISPCSSG